MMIERVMQDLRDHIEISKKLFHRLEEEIKKKGLQNQQYPQE